MFKFALYMHTVSIQVGYRYSYVCRSMYMYMSCQYACTYVYDFMIINTFINMHLLTFLLHKQDERSTCSVSVFLVYISVITVTVTQSHTHDCYWIP